MKLSACVALLPVLLATTACSTLEPAAESSVASAVDYNRAFARARDEITVLNILRASERQPLQFSTISSVQGGLKTGTSVKIPFTNIIAGGVNSISPEITITSRNPAVSIVPLATKEFIRGMSRPIEAELIDDLLAQGWKKEVVLPLVVGGVVCAHDPAAHQDKSADFIKLNDGEDGERDAAFLRVLTGKNTFTLTAPPTVATLRVTSKDALSFLKDGVGSSYAIQSVTPIATGNGGAEEALVKVVAPGKVQVAGLDFSAICGPAGAKGALHHDAATGGPANEKQGVILRSVLSMFRYLGQAQAAATRRQIAMCRDGKPTNVRPTQFNIMLACGNQPIPPYSLVSTRFQGHDFFIPPAGELGADNHTLETLSLLSYLVGLQTSETSLRGASPFVTITQ